MQSLDHHVEEWTLVVEGKEPTPGGGTSQAPQHFLNFFPLPHGHGSLRPIFGLVTLVVATLRDEWIILRKEMIERAPELGTADAFEAMSVEIRSLFDTFRADRPKRYQQHYWKMVFAPNRWLATPLMMEKLSDRALDAAVDSRTPFWRPGRMAGAHDIYTPLLLMILGSVGFMFGVRPTAFSHTNR